MLSKEYLLQRGYCCGHGCLMCPYEPKHKKDNTNLREEFMSKANSNFDHLVKDKHGDKEVKGTYYTIHELEERVTELDKYIYAEVDERIDRLEKRIDRLEAVITNFMNNWGPEVQEARSRRDEIWDEMVRVVSIQKKHKDK